MSVARSFKLLAMDCCQLPIANCQLLLVLHLAGCRFTWHRSLKAESWNSDRSGDVHIHVDVVVHVDVDVDVDVDVCWWSTHSHRCTPKTHSQFTTMRLGFMCSSLSANTDIHVLLPTDYWHRFWPSHKRLQISTNIPIFTFHSLGHQLKTLSKRFYGRATSRWPYARIFRMRIIYWAVLRSLMALISI